MIRRGGDVDSGLLGEGIEIGVGEDGEGLPWTAEEHRGRWLDVSVA